MLLRFSDVRGKITQNLFTACGLARKNAQLHLLMSYVMNMIAEGEHQRQDFKTRVDDARKIARTLSAFANTDGGRLLIGVKDDGTIAGVNAEEEYHMLHEAAQTHCKPAVPFEVQVWKAEYRTVLEVQVPRSAGRPHFAETAPSSDAGPERWQAFLRRDAENLKANPVMVKVWQYEMRSERPEFHYDQHIGKVFRAWREGKTLQFKHVLRKGRLLPDEAEDLLSLLVVWGIVEMEPTPRGFVYRLASEAALDRLETHGADSFRWNRAG
jgi:predicted HTH transcriptional regulator